MALTCCIAALAFIQIPQPLINDEKVGEGPEAKFGDIVSINYVGRVLDGRIFDSTRLGPPFAFVLGQRQLIQGHSRLALPALDRALVGMKAGGKRTVTLPPEQAFGELQVGEIPAGSKLTLEIELLHIRAKGSEPELKMESVSEGVGEPAQLGDSIEVLYKGTFLNGVVFDSAYGRPQEDGTQKDVPYPVVLGSTRIIKGFEQALIGMKAGSKKRVVVPYDMAYGANGRPPAIPAYSVLVFELAVTKVRRP